MWWQGWEGGERRTEWGKERKRERERWNREDGRGEGEYEESESSSNTGWLLLSTIMCQAMLLKGLLLFFLIRGDS